MSALGRVVFLFMEHRAADQQRKAYKAQAEYYQEQARREYFRNHPQHEYAEFEEIKLLPAPITLLEHVK